MLAIVDGRMRRAVVIGALVVDIHNWGGAALGSRVGSSEPYREAGWRRGDRMSGPCCAVHVVGQHVMVGMHAKALQRRRGGGIDANEDGYVW